MLDSRRLRVFNAVCAHGSFSAAADELDYTQSAVSQHVAMLEREVGATLIERGTRPLRPTDAGALLLEDAAPALQHLQRAESRLVDLVELRTGSVRLGAFPSAQAAIVPHALAAFRRAHPDVEVTLEEAEPSAILPALRSGELDLGIVHTLPDSPHPFQAPVSLRPLGEDRLLLVVPPDHRLARRRRVRLAELAEDHWVAPPSDPPNDFRALFDSLCGEAGFTPRIAVETSDPTTGIALARAGLGPVLIPALALRRSRETETLVVQDIPAARLLWVAILSGRRHPAANALSDEIAAAVRSA